MGVNHPESAQRDQDLQSLIDASQTYQPEGDHKLLSDVWHFARKAHRGQHRLDGKAFFSHPVSVAHILSERKADIACLCAGLLHDVVEDTDVELADLRKAFGPEIATIVDGVTKLSKIEGRNLSQDEYTAHNLNKLVSAITSDVRVLVVKLADRMHNMRTIQVMKPEKQRRIAVETQDYYVPFARYIAIELWADELQELVFEILNPEGYQSIKRNLERHYQGSSNESAKAIRQKLEDDLKGFGIKAHVSGRMKAPYSIWLKMRTRKVSFQQLSDVMAFRVVIDNADDCYRVLGHLHRRYQLRPGRFKDYISVPKENGYRSLHTNIIGPFSQPIEVQIRTEAMHDQAEYGSAAHWHYKDQVEQSASHDTGKQNRIKRFAKLRDILKGDMQGGLELHHSRLELDPQEIMAFTPNSDIIWLPRGASVIDFAFKVHTELAQYMVGAEINGRSVPIYHQIATGDQIRIKRGTTLQLKAEWKRYVKTGTAYSVISQFEKRVRRQRFIDQGLLILNQAATRLGYTMHEKALEKAAGKMARHINVSAMLARIGESRLQAGDVIAMAYPGARKKLAELEKNPSRGFASKQSDALALSESKGDAHTLMVDSAGRGLTMHLATCCNPIPGDDLVGIPVLSQGVRVHVVGCEELVKFEHFAQRWIKVSWRDMAHREWLPARLAVSMQNQPGAMGQVTTAIGHEGGNITDVRFVERDEQFFKMGISLEVKDIKHLQDIIAAIGCAQAVESVKRV